MKIRLFAAIPLFAVLALFQAYPARSALEPSVLRASLENEPTTLDWNHFRSGTDRFLISFLMRGLLQYDAKLNLVCDLCTSFSVSPDGLTIQFELRPDLTWSDGVPLEARHFVDSFRRLLDPVTASRNAKDFEEISGALQPGTPRWDPNKLGVAATDKNSLRITLARSSPLLLHRLAAIAAFPIRKELLRGPGDKGLAHMQSAVLGPYLLAEWKPKKRLVLEGNPEFKGTRPVYRVDFSIGSHAELVDLFRKGRLDVLPNPTTEDMVQVPGQRVQVNYSFLATRYMLLNVKRPMMSETKLRRAILYSLDRETLPALMRNGDRKITGLIPPGLVGHRELPLATGDPGRALAERGSGARPIELKLLFRDVDKQERIARWVAERLEKIQVKTVLVPASGATFRERIKKGDFDLALLSWAYRTPSPLEMLTLFRTGDEENRSGWTNVGYDGLLDLLLKEQRPAEIAKLVDQMTEILEIKEVPVIPLDYPSRPFLLGKRVKSFAVTPFGDPDLVKIQLTP
ncbi:MAG: peptide ABC transporter substrate-binding protein [Oligoflexia bacterium]|nr:peptide ABC transporter substrate-binding protein [Oligoflexia bacterium]